MKIVSGTQLRLWTRYAEHHAAQQSRQLGDEVESVVEVVLRLGCVEPRILALLDRMVASTDRALDVGQNDVDTARAADFAASTPSRSGQHGMNASRIQGYHKTRAIVQTYPDITGIISGNDEMALGAIAALKQMGKLKSKQVR